MKRLFSLVFVIILSACGSGSNSDKASESQALSDGFELIDQQRYDEALLYFQGVYQNRPTDDALKGWASVYIARAGLKISYLYEAFSTFPMEQKVNQQNILIQIKAYQNSLEKIPYLKGQARRDIQSATAILKNRNSASVRLLRAILNIVLLRSTFSDGDKSILNAHFKIDLEKDKDIQVICKLEWRKLKAWIMSWSIYGLELRQDLEFAFPSKKKNWQEGEKFFVEARKFSTSIVRACDP